jgi:hypothetical protein
MIYAAIILLAAVTAVLGYLAYNFHEDWMNLRSAIVEHKNVKTAPYGVADVDIDVADRHLWERAGIE